MCSSSENYNRNRKLSVGVANGPSKTLGLAKILVEFHGLCAVMCVSDSRFFARLRVLKFRFVYFLMTSSRHSVLNFIKATCNFQETVNPNFS